MLRRIYRTFKDLYRDDWKLGVLMTVFWILYPIWAVSFLSRAITDVINMLG
jgi:hypothetical protein